MIPMYSTTVLYDTLLVRLCHVDQVIKLLLTYSGDDGDYNDLYDALVTLMVTGADEALPMEPQHSRVLVSLCLHVCHPYVCYILNALV